VALESRPTPRVTSDLPRARPLLVRKGAHYTCFGDGLCCTDIHALGPVTPREKRALELIEPGRLIRHKDLLAPVFRTVESGACVLRSERGCELHAVHGAQHKPAGCMRFPFGLVATPEGGRVTTEHRCPCRTLGDRPPISVDEARDALVDAGGRLVPNGRVGARLPLDQRRRIPFARFRPIEQAMIDALLSGGEPTAVLDMAPFGKLEGERWKSLAAEMRRERDGTAYGEAMLWFGNAILKLVEGERLLVTPRPWATSYDQAAARGGEQPYRVVLNDWLADLLWSLDWVFVTRSFHAGRRELSTLYTIALTITQRLIRARVRPDRAAAEAVTIVELARQSGPWERVQQAL
jgi:hypothetical protein